MKALILTCNTGEGHNSAAAAIRETFLAQGAQCDIVDSLNFISQRASKFISNWHVRIYKYMPNVFRTGYAFAEKHPGLFEEEKWINKYLSSGAGELYELIQENQYDVIIAVHVFAGVVITALRQKYKVDIPACFVATDYTCAPITEECDVEIFFIPHEGLIDEYVAAGIPKDKLVPTGIPIRSGFRAPVDKGEARARLGMEKDEKNILLMGGSMGCGPIDDLVADLAEHLPDGATLTVVCGTNEKRLRALSKRPAKNVRLLGFSDQVPLLMDAADLFISKPGGISISEAGTKGLPLLLLNTVGGCETRNLAYFTFRGWAGTADTVEELSRCCIRLLEQPEALSEQSARLKAAFSADPSMEIFRYVSEHFPVGGKEDGGSVS